jgi:hypothetical protein
MSNSINLSMKELAFLKPSGSTIPLKIDAFDLIKQNDILHECRLSFQVSSQLYQQIDAESLLNLKLELRGSPQALKFHDEIKIEIEATLQPQLLPQLLEYTDDIETAIDYLIACSQADSPSNPLLSTESWFVLSVKQHLESGEIGYRTFWSYLNPASLTPEAITTGQFAEAMEQFLKDRNETNLSMAGKAITEVLEELSNDLKNWDETEFLKQTETAIADFFAEITHSLENLAEPTPPIGQTKAKSKGQIYQTMLNFFSDEDWEFTKLHGELTLRLACAGQNGQWNCYAKAIEEYQLFIFYSICPLEILENQQAPILELLTRVNSGLALGNFELDFNDRTICFRTSIDVTGDRFTPGLLQRLVYTNITMMDKYLPSIQAVLDGESPTIALQNIEQPIPEQPP